MTDERQYSDEEVTEIFRHATREGGREAGSQAPGEERPGDTPSRDLTLREIQEIGEEVGISREVVARSAAALDAVRGGGEVTRRALGVPLAVSRTAELARPLTGPEWERLVVDLRQTFHARGVIREQGNFREWSNGNLHAMLEPAGDGERFRIGTRRSAGEFPIYMGAAMILFAILLGVITLITGAPLAEVIRETGVLALVGGMGFGFGTVALNRWAGERMEQMDAISERVALMAATPPTGAEGRTAVEGRTDRPPPLGTGDPPHRPADGE